MELFRLYLTISKCFYRMTLSSVDLNAIDAYKVSSDFIQIHKQFKLLNIVIKVFIECEMRPKYDSSFSPSSSRFGN